MHESEPNVKMPKKTIPMRQDKRKKLLNVNLNYMKERLDICLPVTVESLLILSGKLTHHMQEMEGKQ